MKYVVNGRSPASVFRFFEEISAIPRGSHNEGQIAEYLVSFAKERGLEYYRDELNNVLIKKPATVGQEERPTLLFQGHTDMVCEKNSDVVHDFLKDPLDLWVDGKLLRAKGTTLGADNGIAVAIMLALLNGEVAEHPAYECLFTTAEETGLNGAQGFDYSLIQSRTMINMDSEELGVVTCGCAGGLRSDLTLRFASVPFMGEALRVHIGGLMGGHSGADIHTGRANANKLMGRLLAALLPQCDARVVAVNGGSKDNAIPRECEVILAVPNADDASGILSDAAAVLAGEMVPADRGFTVRIETAEPEAYMLEKDDTAHVCAVLACAANGVLAMNRDVAGLVEYSRNLGVVRTEGEQITFVFSSRSGIEGRLDASICELDMLAAAVGGEARHYSRYPGWEFLPESAIRNAYTKAYSDVTGKQAKINVIHAGLECGIIYSKLPDMDVISIGPDMFDIHSPDEALDLESTETFWKTLVRLIETV